MIVSSIYHLKLINNTKDLKLRIPHTVGNWVIALALLTIFAEVQHKQQNNE